MSQADVLNQTALPAQRLCAHCGEPVPAGELRAGEERSFCCSGCRQVYRILHDLGYEDYYRLHRAEGMKVPSAHVSGRRFEDFDDESFLRRYVKGTENGTLQVSFHLEGVHCAACVWLVEHLPHRHSGLLSVRLDLPRARADVEWNPTDIRLSDIACALDAIGYTPHPYREADLSLLRKKEDLAFLYRMGVAAACAGNIMMLHFALYAGMGGPSEATLEQFFRYTAFLLCIPVVVYSAKPFLTAAWGGLKERTAHIDLPISIGILAGFGHSALSTIRQQGEIYFDSVAVLVALLLAGRLVQRLAQRRALEVSEQLAGASFTDFARKVQPDGSSREVPLEVLQANDIIELRAGDTVPADALVLAGQSHLDNAILSGESTPVSVEPGSWIHAGAVNLRAALTARVAAVGDATRLGGLLKLTKDAETRRAPIVQTADRLSKVFVITVLALTIGTFLVWLYLDPAHALEHAIALLVVSCPCALGLATPIAMTATLARAARQGLYIKGADIVERLRGIRTVVFDKTGTLTTGRLSLQGWTGTDDQARRLTALERQSSHPVAQAVERRFSHLDVRGVDTRDVQETSGRGITGIVDGIRVAVGSRAFMLEQGVVVPEATEAFLRGIQEDNLSPLFHAEEGYVRAVAGVGDALRPDALRVLRRLRDEGRDVYLYSGDEPRLVARVAETLGLAPERAFGGLSPEEKHAKLSALKETTTGGVLMVGDGVNDAAALALADVGVGVRGGSGASVQAADIVLTRPGLDAVLSLFAGARRTMRVIHILLAFSLIYNLFGATLAMLGLVGPLVAAVLMPISSLTVISIGVLATRIPRDTPPKGRAT